MSSGGGGGVTSIFYIVLNFNLDRFVYLKKFRSCGEICVSKVDRVLRKTAKMLKSETFFNQFQNHVSSTSKDSSLRGEVSMSISNRELAQNKKIGFKSWAPQKMPKIPKIKLSTIKPGTARDYIKRGKLFIDKVS